MPVFIELVYGQNREKPIDNITPLCYPVFRIEHHHNQGAIEPCQISFLNGLKRILMK